MIDQPTIDRILDAAQIVDVVSEFVTLRKRGVNYVGLCPFHDDRTPSFYVSPAKGLCKCFACGKGGNVVHFVMEHEQMSYPEALRWLGKKYGIEVPERQLTDEERNAQSRRESMLVVNEFARTYFENTLHMHPDGRSIGTAYFRSRGIRDDIVRKFQLGYCTQAPDAFAREATTKGYKREFLLATGLCYEKDDHSLRNRFRGRVIFPWHNVSGRIVGFGGRVLDSRTKGVTQKYVNSPDSEVYGKRRELYGIFQAKSAIVKHDRVYMVEGYTDVIAMHQSGLENVVANSGTALSPEQIRLLHRFTSNITLLYDGDEAGIKASLRGIDLLLTEGMNVRVLLLPEGDDPDSFVRKHTTEGLRRYIGSHEENFLRFKARLLMKDASDDPVKRASVITDMAHSIGLIPDEVVRYECLKDCASLLGVDERLLTSEAGKVVRERMEPAPVVERPVEPSPSDDKELDLVRMLVRYGERILCRVTDDEGQEVDVSVADYIAADLQQDELELRHPLHRRMLDEAVQGLSDPRFSASRHFLSHPDGEVSRLAARLLSDTHRLSRTNEEQMQREEERLPELVPYLLIGYKMDIVEQERQSMMQLLSQPAVAGDAARCAEVMAELRRLMEVRKMLAKRLGERVVV